jgi:hypothetical protein
MLLFLAGACVDVKGHGSPDSGDTGFLWRDTSIAPTDDTGETGGDTAGGDTHDTGETGETGDTGGPAIAALDVYPAAMIVHPGATWTLRVVSTQRDGSRGDDGAGTFTSADPAVATVDQAGVVVAVAEGTTTIEVALGGLVATHAVEVRADGVATVTVVDASTGLPIADARVALPFTEPVRTDASGVARVPVADGGAVSLTAWVDDDWNAVTVGQTVGRSFTIPLWPKDTDARSATLFGQVDFSGVDDPTWEELAIGFASASIQGALATIRLDDLFADERSISVIGIDVEAPSNLFVEGAQEDYYATAAPGGVAAWGLGGPVAIAEAGDSLEGTGDALAPLVDHLDDMSWGWGGPAEAIAAVDTRVDLAPAARFDGTLAMTLPDLSLGFQGTEELFVLVTEERADVGHVATGLGLGTGAVDVRTVADGSVADSLGTVVLAYGQVGGVGSGGATAASVGRPGADGAIAFPALPAIASFAAWDPATHDVSVDVDAGARFVRLRLRDNRHRVHDVVLPGDWSGTLPNAVNDFGFAQAELEIVAVDTEDGAYEQWLAEGALDPDALPSARAVARTTLDP